MLVEEEDAMELELHRFFEKFGSRNMTKLEENTRMSACFKILSEANDMVFLKGMTSYTLSSKESETSMTFQQDKKRDGGWYVDTELDGSYGTFMKL